MNKKAATHAQEWVTLRSGMLVVACRCGWVGNSSGYWLRRDAAKAYHQHKHTS